MNKVIISYSEYSLLLDELVEKIKAGLDLSKIEMIYTYLRGGLPIAVHLSHALNIKMFTDETPVDFYKYEPGTILVVDDIADTGQTLLPFMPRESATIYYHKQSVVEPTIWIYEKKDAWVHFPWE